MDYYYMLWEIVHVSKSTDEKERILKENITTQ